MNENMNSFRTWCLNQFELLSARYRMDLLVVVNTCREYAEGNIWEPKHTKAGIECLPNIPSIGKYEGEVSADDRDWYKAVRKPNFSHMHEDAAGEIRALETTLTVSAGNADLIIWKVQK